jgi:hypothetical protein
MGARVRSGFAAFAFALMAASPAAAVDVTACGQVVPPGELGVLVSTLNCPASPVPAIRLGEKAVLDMAASSLILDAGVIGIECSSQCTIVGFGHVGGGDVCVRVTSNGSPRATRLDIDGLTVSGCDRGIDGESGKPGLHLRARNLTVTANGRGILAQSVRGVNVQVNNNEGAGVVAGSGSIRGKGFFVADNGVGLSAFAVHLEDSTVIGHTGVGILASRATVTLRNSTVTGNAVDVASKRPPRLRSSICERSARFVEFGEPLGPTWSVCVLD